MIDIHVAIPWGLFGLGLLAGAVGSALFFAGLAFGIRLALNRSSTTALLLLSALVRIAMLLLLGVWIAKQGVAAMMGFLLAFMIVRFMCIVIARPAPADQNAHGERVTWN